MFFKFITLGVDLHYPSTSDGLFWREKNIEPDFFSGQIILKKDIFCKRPGENIKPGRSTGQSNLLPSTWGVTTSQVPQPTCSWKWHPDTCQLGNRLVTTAKLDDNLHGWTTDCLDGFQKSFQVIFIGPRSDHSLPMSVTHWLTHDLLELMSRPCWRLNEVT